MAERKVVTLRCSDGTDVEVEEAVAMMSITIRRKIEAGHNGFIELPDIGSAALGKVIEYCTKHAAEASSASGPSATAPSSSLKKWDTSFISSMDETTLSDIVSASDCLDVKGLQLLSVSKKLVTLRCGIDHDNFIVEGHIALKLRLLRSMLLVQPKCANSPILLPNVASATLAPVLEFYRKQTWAEAELLNETGVNRMIRNFVKVHVRKCFDLIRAASYLEAQSLLEVLVNSVKAVPRLAGLTAEEIVTGVVEGHYTKDEENAMVVQLGNAVA